jgi:hypothetical protein
MTLSEVQTTLNDLSLSIRYQLSADAPEQVPRYPSEKQKSPANTGFSCEPTGGLEPPTPSLRGRTGLPPGPIESTAVRSSPCKARGFADWT